MATWKTYLLPTTLSQAIHLFKSYPSACTIVGGGTDLLLEIQQDHHTPADVMVDVTRISELSKLEIRSDQLFIGAGVPLKSIAASALVNQHAQALAESTGQIGGPQVRAVGTLGGNVAHALPAGDGAISLIALDAKVEVAGVDGNRLVPILDMYRGPGVSSLKTGQELIVGFYVPIRSTGQGSAFSRVMRPQGVALPVINMSIWLEVVDRKIIRSRVAVGPAGPTPKRALDVESLLCSQELTDVTLENAREALHGCIHFRSSPLRATSQYRDHLADVLLGRVLKSAYARAVTG